MEYEINSKKVEPGNIFVAIKGNNYDGHDFIEEAIQNGAVKIIAQKDVKSSVPVVKVKNTKNYIKRKGSKLLKKYSKQLTIIGITGTKGKTTTAFITYQLLKQLKINVAYIGTLGFYHNDIVEPLENTTPDIMTIAKLLNRSIHNEATHVVMEISSHALSEKRIKGLKLNVGAFTNFSQDHLDYYHTMDNYLKSKLKIIKYVTGPIILNNDDKSSYYFKKKTRNFFTVGKNGMYELLSYNLNTLFSIVSFKYLYDTYTIAIPYVGKHNIYNYLMALCILDKLGFSINDIINVTNYLQPIKGRGQLIKSKKGNIIIDYAHSPKSVEAIINTYNEIKRGRIITIIGCGGDRDKLKRPIMGKIASEKSDHIILTSDNPRTEDPFDILKDMEKGITIKNYEIIENRKEAIKKGVKLLKNNDYLLILGKGHENYQIIGTTKHHFDDAEETQKIISSLR